MYDNALRDRVEEALVDAECHPECMFRHKFTTACDGCQATAVLAALGELYVARWSASFGADHGTVGVFTSAELARTALADVVPHADHEVYPVTVNEARQDWDPGDPQPSALRQWLATRRGKP